MALKFLVVWVFGMHVAGFCRASTYGEDVRYTQCRASITDAPYLFGPATASGNPVNGIPQQCGFLFPGRNNYNKKSGGNNAVIGEFVAPDCGACAAACAASYLSVTNGGDGPFTFMDSVVQEMEPSALLNFKEMLVQSVEKCTPCTDWNYCSPEVAVVTTSTSLTQEPGENGTWYYVPDDSYFGDKCAGRYVDGEMKPYGYVGYGPDLCLVKSTTGCPNPTPGDDVPPGTCTLKTNTAPKVSDHFPVAIPDEESNPGYIGTTNEDLWDYVSDASGNDKWSKGNTKWSGDDCDNNDLPYPTIYADDLKGCSLIDPDAGVFMSGMCDWTPAMSDKPLDIKAQCRDDNERGQIESFKSALDEWVNNSINKRDMNGP